MKKVLLIALFVFTLVLIGCEYKDENVTTNSGDISADSGEKEEVTNEIDISTMSFEERTKEVREFMNKDNEFGISPYWGSKPTQQHYVESASLDKEDSYYVMKVRFNTPKIYEKEEIIKVYELAQNEGKAKLGDYTFYKDNVLPPIEETIDEYIKTNKDNDKGFIYATKEGEADSFYVFRPTPKDDNKYYVFWSDNYIGDIIFEFEKEIEVKLLPEDKMTITYDRDYAESIGKELTVEEYYTKAINNEVSSDSSIQSFEYSLYYVGSSFIPFETTNAVNFDNGCINVSYHYGGI